MALQALAAAVDAVAALDDGALADAAAVEALLRQLHRLNAIAAGAVAAFDAEGAWAADGARSASVWVAVRCRVPKEEARRLVRQGRSLRQLPECAKAWRDGDITGSHVAAIAAVYRDSTRSQLVQDEALLVEQASALGFADFRRVVAYWEQLADPDGVERASDRQVDRRSVHLDESMDGMWFGAMTLDPVAGAAVADELGRLERSLFESEWASVRERTGREPTWADLIRSPGQRRADALVEMAARSRSAAPDGRRPAPLFSVLVGYETLYGRVCELANGQVVTPGAVARWIDRADIERVVFGPGDRVQVGPAVRFFTGATRRGIEVRDRTCTHPFCDEPVERCEADHVVPYAFGGATIQENGRLLCAFHNRQRNGRPPPDYDPLSEVRRRRKADRAPTLSPNSSRRPLS